VVQSKQLNNAGLSGDTEEARPARPRRRRGRRTTAAERQEAAGDDAGDVIEPSTQDENSVIEVEPELLAAQEVESFGVSPRDVLPSASTRGPWARQFLRSGTATDSTAACGARTVSR